MFRVIFPNINFFFSAGFLLWFVLHLNFYFMNFCNIFSYELGISVQNHVKQNWSHGWSYSQNQLHLNTKWHFDIILNNVLTNFTNNPRPISGHLALGRFNFSNEQTFSGKKIGMPLINIILRCHFLLWFVLHLNVHFNFFILFSCELYLGLKSWETHDYIWFVAIWPSKIIQNFSGKKIVVALIDCEICYHGQKDKKYLHRKKPLDRR